MINQPKSLPPVHRERLLDLSTGTTVPHPSLLDLTAPAAAIPSEEPAKHGDDSGKVVRPPDASLPNVRNKL
jgi:hypothetical protein